MTESSPDSLYGSTAAELRRSSLWMARPALEAFNGSRVEDETRGLGFTVEGNLAFLGRGSENDPRPVDLELYESSLGQTFEFQPSAA